MGEFMKEWAETLSQIGLGGFAVYALVNVWNRLIKMSDQHRQDNTERDKEHKKEVLEMAKQQREEIASIERKHVEELANLNREHRKEVQELVIRNMDEHRDRNRVQVMLGMETAKAFTTNRLESPDPYPDIDESGRDDPRKKS